MLHSLLLCAYLQFIGAQPVPNANVWCENDIMPRECDNCLHNKHRQSIKPLLLFVWANTTFALQTVPVWLHGRHLVSNVGKTGDNNDCFHIQINQLKLNDQPVLYTTVYWCIWHLLLAPAWSLRNTTVSCSYCFWIKIMRCALRGTFSTSKPKLFAASSIHTAERNIFFFFFLLWSVKLDTPFLLAIIPKV